MYTKSMIFGICGAVCALFAQSVAAEECGPLKIISSVDLKTEPQDNRFYLPVVLQGQQKYMLLDTGGTFSEITQDVVASLNLPTHKSMVRVYDISGNYIDHVAVVPSFAIGTLSGQNVEFMVGADQRQETGSEVAGILGPNILRFYDVSVDFGAGKLTLLSQDHCPGKVIYWPATAVAVIPMTFTKLSGHIHVPVTLDGQQLNAAIDTGSTNTALNLTAAAGDFGLDSKKTNMSPVGELQNRNQDVIYRHSFKTLSFNGVNVSNPSIDIIPDLIHGQLDRPPPTGTRFKDSEAEENLPDLLIGMDVLRHLHIFVAYKEQNLYITPAETSVEAVAATPIAAAGKSATAPTAAAAASSTAPATAAAAH